MSRHYGRVLVKGEEHNCVFEGDRVNLLEGDVFGDHSITNVTFPVDEVSILTPCKPGKIICVGLNYRQHAEELGLAIPAQPILFLKPATTLLAPEGEIIYWPDIGQMDYEGELAVVLGKGAHFIEPEHAMDHVFGYTIANDITARDLQQEDGQWTRAKSFDTFLPLGPSIRTGIDASDLSLQTFVNGHIKQSGRTSDLIFPIPYLISFISRVMTLYPGDIIITGTPSGIGPLQVGDSVEVRIEELGSLTNTVVAW